MSTAIFLAPRGDGGGYRIELCEDHTDLPDGFNNLIVEDEQGRQRFHTLGEGDWVQLRDRIDRMLRR